MTSLYLVAVIFVASFALTKLLRPKPRMRFDFPSVPDKPLPRMYGTYRGTDIPIPCPPMSQGRPVGNCVGCGAPLSRDTCQYCGCGQAVNERTADFVRHYESVSGVRSLDFEIRINQ